MCCVSFLILGMFLEEAQRMQKDGGKYSELKSVEEWEFEPNDRNVY